jgi:hypothetical protein
MIDLINALAEIILDLVQMAESPLYSTYKWVGQQLGRDVAMSEFFRAVDDAIREDLLRLFSVDSGVRTELFSLPPDLESRYKSEPDLDDAYDPFSLTLTPGIKAPEHEPDWEMDIDFEGDTFALLVRESDPEAILAQVARLYPGLRFLPSIREELTNGMRVSGTIAGGDRSGR